jgi:hypothetical protein
MIALKLPSFPTSVLLLGSFIGLFCIYGSVTTSARATSSPSQKGDPNTLAGQFQELQKQVADLQKLVTELQKTRIVASGTTTFKLAGDQDNATNIRVMLNEEIAKRIGEDYIVLLTQRFPAGGYPFFVPLWKRASDGFDITLVDVALGPNETASYANKNKSYLVDWIVVKK